MFSSFAFFELWQYLSDFGEFGFLGIGFGTLLVFVLQQYRSLLAHLTSLQREIIGVVEKNTVAYVELRQAFDQLRVRVS